MAWTPQGVAGGRQLQDQFNPTGADQKSKKKKKSFHERALDTFEKAQQSYLTCICRVFVLCWNIAGLQFVVSGAQQGGSVLHTHIHCVSDSSPCRAIAEY